MMYILNIKLNFRKVSPNGIYFLYTKVWMLLSESGARYHM